VPARLFGCLVIGECAALRSRYASNEQKHADEKAAQIHRAIHDLLVL
jgi:sensor domain CHASE-containing protein